MIREAFSQANQWTLRVWFEKWPLWLGLYLSVEIFNQFLIAILDGFEASQGAYLLGGIMTSAMDFTLALMVPVTYRNIKNNRPTNLQEHLKRVTNQAAIESLRATARVCWYSYLLILPGLIKFIRLLFVPYVVQFDDSYEAGRMDALKQSENLSRGNLLKMIMVLIVTSFLILLESLKSTFVWNSWSFLVAFLLTLPIRIYSQIVWFNIYEYSKNQSMLKGDL